MIEVENISKIFEIKKKNEGIGGAIKSIFSNEKLYKVAVDHVSFHIDKGEIVGYIGNNGAGKSTTIKMMTGILTPTSGTCLVNGINPIKDRKKNARNIGAVFGQRTQLWWDLPLADSFSILKEIYGVSKRDYIDRMDFLNEVLQINEFFDCPVRTLSLGQRMRADLAVSLIHNPKVLYLDEPTIGLDLVVKDNMRKAIKEINRNYSTTVVLTTHDMEDIEELCKRIIVINSGSIVYDGTIENITECYNEKVELSIRVNGTENIRASDITQALNIPKSEFKIMYEEKRIKVWFNKNILSIATVISVISRYTEIQDMEIVRMNISDIIKEIYINGIQKAN